MGRAGAFTTISFMADDGYVIRDVSREIGRAPFRDLLHELRSPGTTVDLGLSRDVRGKDLATLLSQLDEPPGYSGVKQVDVRGIERAVAFIEGQDGFREAWVIGDDRGGPLRGTGRDDVVLARGGNDRVVGGNGDDFISGGTGRDRLSGRPRGRSS